RQAESQAQIYQIDLEHADKVLSMQDDKVEPAKLQEVVEVVTTAKLMTEVVTAASATITVVALQLTNAAASTLTTAPSATRKRKGVVIRDPKETATPSTIIHSEAKSKYKGKGILVEEPKPLKKQAQIKQDETYARELKAELNKNIDWDEKTKEQIDEEDSKALKGEDLEALWRLVKERLATTKPKNFFDDFLLTTLGAMFEKPNIITFTTTQLILLVERKYPLTRPSAPIIEDWFSHLEDDSEPEIPQNVPSFFQPTEQVKPPRHVVPKAVLTQSKLVSITAARRVPTTVLIINVTIPRHAKTVVTKPPSPPRRHINHSSSPKVSNFPLKVTVSKAFMVNVVKGGQGKWEWKPKCPILDYVSRTTSASMTLKRFDYNDALGDPRVIDSGCSRHMTWNMSYLFDFEEINGRYVAFGGNQREAEAVNTAC
nr:hypothetical protein [Tanacetum cinerariifolium]